MPIKAENMPLYPGGSIKSKEWAAIRAYVRARAGDRCEGCGVQNGLIGVRHQGKFYPVPYEKPGTVIGFRAFDYVPMKVIKIVCTVAHVDHSLDNHHTDKLRFWCQQCHNRHDAPERAKNRRRA